MDPLKHRVYTCPEGCCGVFIPHYVDIRKIEREHAEDVKKEKRIRKHKKIAVEEKNYTLRMSHNN